MIGKVLATGLAAALMMVGTVVSAAGLDVRHVAGNAYALVGPLGQRSSENLGNNATFGFIVTDDGVVLIDSGGSLGGAQQIEAAVATVTDKPVRMVINTGVQDHRWLGNAYFASKGATVVAAEGIVAGQRDLADGQFDMMRRFIGDAALAGTDAAFADTTFQTKHAFDFGGTELELLFVGPAHTQGETIVWLPEHRVAFAGDIVYLDRLLAVLPHSDTRSWVEAFGVLSGLRPEWIVPGHGGPAALKKVENDTLDYLMRLRTEVGKVLEAGGDELEAVQIDQSGFEHLEGFDELHGRNAQQVYIHMEWE
jgi:glyoxylase-like metal-dependent hydrolase (beta-lactamase superfamily II)